MGHTTSKSTTCAASYLMFYFFMYKIRIFVISTTYSYYINIVYGHHKITLVRVRDFGQVDLLRGKRISQV